MNDLLFDSSPLVLQRELVCMVGINEAVILQQIHYWCEVNRKAGRNFHDGRYWTYNTFDQWSDEFPWLSKRHIQNLFAKLEKDGYLISGNYNQMKMDRTKWYTLDYDKIKQNQPLRKNFVMQDEDSSLSNTKKVRQQYQRIPETSSQRLTGKENIVQNDSVLNLREKTRTREDDKREANKERRDELNEIFSKPENSTYLELVNKYVDRWYPYVMGKEHPQLGKQLRMEHALVFKDFISQAGNLDFEDLVDILLFAVQRGGDYEPELKQRIDPTLAWITTKQVLGYCAVKAGFDYAQIQYTDYDFNKETRGLM